MDNDWNGFADLITNLITKYAGVLDLDNLLISIPADDVGIKSDIANKILIEKIM